MNARWKLQCCFFFCWGQNQTGQGLLADSWRPPRRWRAAGVAACPWLLQSSGSARLRSPLGSACRELPHSRCSDAAGPLGGEGFSLARDKENSKNLLFPAQTPSPELQQDPGLHSSPQLSLLAETVPRRRGCSSWTRTTSRHQCLSWADPSSTDGHRGGQNGRLRSCG